jgi:hypothetical protein
MISDFSPSTALHRLDAWRGTRMLLFCGLLSTPGLVHAQPADVSTRAAARELATLGAEAFERKEFAAALDHLSRANQLHPAPSISVLQARALEHLGRFIEALDRYEETLRVPLVDDAPEAYRVAVRDAAAESDLLRQRIPHLSVRVRKGGMTPKGTSVMLDGKALPAALLDVDFPADPGTHTVVVSAPDCDPVTRKVNLAERERVVLEITLEGYRPQTAAVPQEREVIVAPPPSTRPIWGWAAVGGGAVSLLISAITGKAALDKKSHLDSVCHPGCPPQNEGDIDAFRSYRTASYIAGGATVAFAGIGGYLLLVRPSETARVGVGAFGTQATVWGSF